MGKILFLLILMTYSFLPIFSQTTEKVSLITKYYPDHPSLFLQRVVKIEFLNGKFASRKDLFTVDVDIAGEIRGLYLDRYLLTDNQTVFGWKPEDEKTFDLQTEEFVDRKTILFKKNGIGDYFKIFSPDGKKSIDFENLPEKLEVLKISIEGREDLLIYGKFAATVAGRSSIRPSLPLIWIDSERILTQRENGDLVIVTLDSKVSPFLKLPCDEDDFPRFRKTRAGKLIYSCSGREYRIDFENRTFERIRNDLDFGFSVDLTQKESVYYYGNEEIGSGGIDSVAFEGFLAVISGKQRNGMFDSNDLNTIKIWSLKEKKWHVFKVNGSDAEILGWYKE
ncbi:MAG: hypothetical protein R2747_05005 [Pyrinomonadaceae bacterium]